MDELFHDHLMMQIFQRHTGRMKTRPARRARTGRLYRLKLAMLSALLSICPQTLHAEDVSYAVREYGTERIEVSFSGPHHQQLTSQLSQDGKLLRVSGAGIRFVSRVAEPTSELLSYLRQVSRGAYTDLLLGFSHPVSLSVAPGSSELKLFLRVRGDTGTASAGTLLSKLPVKVETGVPPSTGAHPHISITFPSEAHVQSRTTLSRQLRQAAYWVDFTWSWISGERAQPPPLQHSVSKDTTEELEQLVASLTSELLIVREQCKEKEAKAGTEAR